MVEHACGHTDDVAGRVYPFGPDHWAPMTWYRCITAGCDVRLDPWEHRTRCAEHQAQVDAATARVRELVDAGRRAGRAERDQ